MHRKIIYSTQVHFHVIKFSEVVHNSLVRIIRFPIFYTSYLESHQLLHQQVAAAAELVFQMRQKLGGHCVKPCPNAATTSSSTFHALFLEFAHDLEAGVLRGQRGQAQKFLSQDVRLARPHEA